MSTGFRLRSADGHQAEKLEKTTAAGDHWVSVTHSYPDIKLSPSRTMRGYQTFQPMDGLRLKGKPGEPMLPVAQVRLLIPPGEAVEEIVVRSAGLVEMPGVHRIEVGSGKVLPRAPDAPCLGQLASVVGVQRKKGHAIVVLDLNPVQYQPKSGRLAVHQLLSVTVKTRAVTGRARIRPRLRAAAEIRKLVDNPEVLESYKLAAAVPQGGIAPQGVLTDPADTYKYVVVAPQALRDAATDYRLQDLMALRTAQGLSSTLVTIEDILANYAGADDAEKLRNFVIDAYNDWETEYVLLAGDTNVMPYRTLRVFGWPDDLDAPSDWYFQCLDGDYNSNGNGFYGETDDGALGGMPDILTEVWVGRASVENATEMSNFVYKTVTHENAVQTEAYLYRAIMASERSPSWNLYIERLIIGHPGDRLMSDHNPYPPDTPASAGLPEYIVPYRLYTESGDNDPGDWDKSNIIALIDSNRYGAVHIGGRSSGTTSSLRMDTTDVDNLTNTKLLVVYDHGDYAGDFSADCIAEHFTSSTRSGAVAALMCSTDLNDGIGTGINETYEDAFHRMFVKVVFEDGVNRAGPANAASKEALSGIFSRVPSEALRAAYAVNLFGDPALRLPGTTALPIMTVKSTTFTDPVGNGDGVINAGETIDLTVMLKNHGPAAANNVNATVSTASGFVSMVTSDAAYGNLSSGGGTGTNAPDYRFTVDAGCPAEEEVEFNIHVTDDAGNQWDRKFTLVVRSSYANITLPASLSASCPAGSSVEKTLTIGNNGTAQLNHALFQVNGDETTRMYKRGDMYGEYFGLPGIEWTADGIWELARRDSDNRHFLLKRSEIDGSIEAAVDIDAAVPGFAKGLAFDGTYVWVGDAGNGKLCRLQPADGSLVSSFFPGSFTDLTWDGTHLWILSSGPSTARVTKYDVSGNALYSFKLPRVPGFGALAWDGSVLWVVGYRPGTLMAFDRQGNLLYDMGKYDDPYLSEGLTFDGLHFWRVDAWGMIRLHSGRSSWLAFSAYIGTVSPAASGDVTVTFNAVGLTPGVYTTTLKVASNDNETPLVDIPVTFTVNPNTPPTISDIADTDTDEDTAKGPIAFTIGDVETLPDNLVLTKSSSNQTLVPDANIVLGGSGANRTVTITPAPNQSGATIITITVEDEDGLQASDSFVLTVNAVNDPPTISDIADTDTDEDTPKGPIAFTIGDVETLPGDLVLTKASSNTTLVPLANIIFGGTGANRTATIIPELNQHGTATITITVEDEGGLQASDSFVLTVNSVNDLPIISTFNPATPFFMQAGTSQVFEVSAHDDDGDLLSYAWEIDGVPTGDTTFDMTYSPTEVDVGPHTIKVTVSDGNGGTDSHTWNVTVTTSVPGIARSTATLSPSCAEGQDAAAQTFEVWNAGGGTLNYTIGDDVAWLSCAPTAGDSTGEHDTITVTYDTDGLAPGTHNATITITAPGAGNTPQAISVTLTVNALPSIGCSTAALSPSCTQGQNAAAQSCEVWNAGVGTLNYTISDDAGWLSCGPGSGDSTGEHDTITVTYTTSGLALGTHNATITITAPGSNNTPQTIAVTLTVTKKSGGGGGSGCALAPGSGSALGWWLPYLLVAGLYLLARLRRRNTLGRSNCS